MNNKRGTEVGLVKALILGIGMASMARAGIAYLPLTGPPALRVLAMRSPQAAQAVPAVKMVESAKVTDTNCLDIKAFNTNTTATVVNATEGFGPTLPGLVLGPNNPLDVPNGASIFMLPAPDTLGMTPQILATYFQPLVVGTNGTAVAAPFRVGFIPPLPEPDKSSHAEYIIK